MEGKKREQTRQGKEERYADSQFQKSSFIPVEFTFIH